MKRRLDRPGNRPSGAACNPPDAVSVDPEVATESHALPFCYLGCRNAGVVNRSRRKGNDYQQVEQSAARATAAAAIFVDHPDHCCLNELRSKGYRPLRLGKPLRRNHANRRRNRPPAATTPLPLPRSSHPSTLRPTKGALTPSQGVNGYSVSGQPKSRLHTYSELQMLLQAVCGMSSHSGLRRKLDRVAHPQYDRQWW